MKKKLITLSVTALGAMAVLGLTSCGGNATLKYQDASGVEQEVKVEKTEDKKQVANIIDGLVYTAYKNDVKTDLTKLGVAGNFSLDFGLEITSGYKQSTSIKGNMNYDARVNLPESATNVEDLYNKLGFSGEITSTSTVNASMTMGTTNLGSSSGNSNVSVKIYNGEGKVYSDSSLAYTVSTNDNSTVSSSGETTTAKGYVEKKDFFSLLDLTSEEDFATEYTKTYNKLKNFNLYKSLFDEATEYKTIDTYLSESNVTLESICTTYGIVVEGVENDVVLFSASADFATLLTTLSQELADYAALLPQVTGNGKLTFGINLKSFIPAKLSLGVTNATVDLSSIFGILAQQSTSLTANASIKSLTFDINLTTGAEVKTLSNTSEYTDNVAEDLLNIIAILNPMSNFRN